MFYVCSDGQPISNPYPTQEAARAALLTDDTIRWSTKRAYCGYDQSVVTIREIKG
jgi:hypothetical protein